MLCTARRTLNPLPAPLPLASLLQSASQSPASKPLLFLQPLGSPTRLGPNGRSPALQVSQRHELWAANGCISRRVSVLPIPAALELGRSSGPSRVLPLALIG